MRVRWPSTAFIDETQAADWYLLAAVIIENRAAAEFRDLTARLRVSAPKVHWWAESDSRRRLLAAHLARIGARHLVVVRRRRTDESDERCRRKCLETLLINLELIGVDRAVFESRERRQNERDRHAVEYLRRAKVLRGGLGINHKPGRTEPLLWLADILAGTVRSSRDGERAYDPIVARLQVIEI